MPAFIRYPFLGCLALFLAACGSSGSQTLLRAPELSPDASTGGYSDVEYLLADSAAITAARNKFVSDPPQNTDATAPTANALTLNSRRNTIVSSADRYLSTGALVVDTTATNHHAARCTDGADASKANCVFPEDALRDEVTFHLGRTHARNNNVGFIGFSADRQPVMDYRGVSMSQVRTTGTDTKTGADPETRDYEYVGYDGILQYSMFFVGVYRFFDDGSTPALEHQRLENASLGLIYDADTDTTAIDNPTVNLTGTGVMAGVETENNTLNSHLVQGDVTINFTTSDNHIDVAISNIKRLVGSGTSWYAGTPTELDWDDVDVENSEFSDSGLSGSFYGTGSNYEVGGTFYHQGGQYSIVGAFGSTVSAP